MLWTLLFACTQEQEPLSDQEPLAGQNPLAGQLALCIPDHLTPSMNSEAPVVLNGDLIEVRAGSGDCEVELVIQEGDQEHVIGYTMLNPNEQEASYFPVWEQAQDITLSIYIQFSFGFSYGVVLEDDDGVLIALEEGYWGGALSDIDLPFMVSQSEQNVGVIETECVTKTGYSFQIDDEYMTPFGSYVIDIEQKPYTFFAIAAMENGPGQSCEVSDMSDQFSWALFRDYALLYN